MAQSITSIQPRAGGFLVSEARGNRSRDAGILVLGQNLRCGAVVGKITASGKYSVYNPANSDGTQTVAGILWDAYDATAADVRVTLVTNDCEVNAGELTWFAGATGPQITTGIAGLLTLGIKARAAL
jgi:hypothetical protein